MEYREVRAGRAEDLRPGKMRNIEVDGRNILLVRSEYGFHALAPLCTHYGADLSKGVLCGRRIVCPWHSAVFDALSGKALEPPALDWLPTFKVVVRDGEIFVLLPDKPPSVRKPPFVKRDLNADERTFIIVGGGAAGAMAAETLREAGFGGRVLLISAERRLPYDRPNLSKGFITGRIPAKYMYLRDENFYRERDVELLLGRRVEEVDADDKAVILEDGQSINYDAILIATGGEPRTLNVPGAGLDGVFTLRSYDDALRIRSWLPRARRAVVVGAGFLGMECAADLRSHGLDVTVVAPESVPLEYAFGEEVGRFFLKLHSENGVRFRLGHLVESFEGNGRVKAVMLDNGERLNADLALVGIGVRPVTGFIKGLGLEKDGRVPVDQCMYAGKSVYAAGDVASFPDWRTGERTHIEHWRAALQLGRTAALNMAGIRAPYRGVPFFWTWQFGVSVRYVGHAPAWDEVVVQGRPEDGDFMAFYTYRDKVLAAVGCRHDREMAAIAELMRLGLLPPADELRGKKFDPLALLECS